ncbi:MAG: HAD hydrolase-like protein [Gammaproteobacteria bacterium]|nr:HAD hydrolase-like protein [Gammaproteobacteria bacterium]
MSVPLTLTAHQAVARYQEVRSRFPNAHHPKHSRTVANLTELVDDIDVFILDGFGVLNVGESVVPGAVEHVSALQRAGKVVKVITNGAGKPVDLTFSKYAHWGFNFSLDDVISSRDALDRALSLLDPKLSWGFMAPDFAQIHRLATNGFWLGDTPREFDEAEGFVLLSTTQWSEAQHQMMVDSLKNHVRPVVVGNPDLVAPHPNGFSLEPGLYAHALADETGVEPEFFGKPFPDVFTLMEERLNVIDRKRIAMVGDTLHTDILGGAAFGWSTVLITDHGLLKGLDVEAAIDSSGIRPDYIAPTT